MAGVEKPDAGLESSPPTDPESPGSSIRDNVAKVQLSPAASWRSYLWDSLDKSREERRFLARLDSILLTYATLGEFAEAMEQLNVNNAFVSGMREDLGLYGNELNLMITTWTVGYILGQIPSNLIITRVRPCLWIPGCHVIWSLLNIGLAKCTSIHQIYIIRFCIGLAESSFYPGMQYIVGSWYRKDELAKRSCIFPSGYILGQMFCGFLMAAIYHLDGVGGFKAWQWLFILTTVISLPIALAGFFVLPDVPEITRSFYLSRSDVALAKKRMELEGRANRGPYTRAKVIKILTSWHLYLLSLLYTLYLNACAFGSQPAFALWLKSKGYSVAAINIYPTLTMLVTLPVTILCAWTSDSLLRGARWPPIVFVGAVNIVISSVMAVWTVPDAAKWAAFFLIALTQGISGLFFAWAHEICSADNEERAIVTASMNKMAFIVMAWLPLVIWAQTDAPRYPRGYITMVFFGLALIICALTTRWLDRRERRHRAETAREAVGAVVSEEGSRGGVLGAEAS